VRVRYKQAAMKQKAKTALAAAREGRSRRAPSGGGRRLSQQAAAPVQWQPLGWHPRHWRINWRRGLIRLWVLASFLWAGYWVYKLQLSCAFWFAPWCESPLHVDWPNQSMALGLALILLSGPVLALLLGLTIIWAIKGFRARAARPGPD
jgi:hypothetical protein